MTTGTRATMDKYADWIDSFWCLAFSLTSIGVWLWYWDMALPIQNL
jgi:hypothetical protein